MKTFKLILKRILSVALCFLSVFSGIFFAESYIMPLANTDSHMVEEVESGRINVLLLATDESGMRTDTIMIASVDTKRKCINVMSVPRDTRVKTGNSYNKINSVYAFANENRRVDAVIEKVNEITGLPINYYAIVKPDGFKNVIDILGGVYIDVPVRMKYSDPDQNLYIDLQPGYQLLDGDKAEQFTRFRSYPTADLGRIEAQQMFISELFRQKVNAELILKIDDIYLEILKNVKTNFTMADIPVVLSAIRVFSGDAIKTFEMPGTPQYINGTSYVICDVEATKEIISKEFLDITENGIN